MPDTKDARTFFASIAERYGQRVTLRGVPLKEFVDAGQDLVKAKIYELVTRGYNRANYWPQFCRIHEMIDNDRPIQTIHLTNSRSFRLTTGYNSRQGTMMRDHERFKVTLNCTHERNEKRMKVDLDERDFTLESAPDLEGEFIALGEAFAKSTRDEIISAYLTDKTTEQARSSDTRYTALQKLVKSLSKVSSGLSAIIMHGDDFATAITEQTAEGSMPFKKALVPASNAGLPFDPAQNKYDGLVGWLDARIPVYVVADYNWFKKGDMPAFAGTILGVAVDESLVCGINKPLTIETEFERFDRSSSLVNAYKTQLAIRYDLQTGNKLGIGYVSGA